MKILNSPVYQRYLWALFLGLLIGLGTVAMGELPHDDWIQGAWVFLSAAVTATIALRRRVDEDDRARYSRLAHQRFEYWVTINPDLVQGLFGQNVPYALVGWFEKETGCNLLDCRKPHIVDSYAKKGDVPGELIFRMGLELGRILEANKGRESELTEILSEKFESLTEERQDCLGEEIGKGIFLKRIKEGDRRPEGVHISSEKSRCLAMLEEHSILVGSGEFDRVLTAALSFKKEEFTDLTDEQWQEVKNLVYLDFPYFAPKEGGSGPQKKQVPLFIQAEKSLTPDEAENYGKKVLSLYGKLDEWRETLSSSDREETDKDGEKDRGGEREADDGGEKTVDREDGSGEAGEEEKK